ncbi:MAG: hypothetical protein HY466_05455 [Deltaproteobacteria bacterium]|nr:hypothetical protein [Deltaproteobacteria bacterium]
MKKILLLSLILLFPSFLQAGGPWKVDTITNSGVPARWPYDEDTGKWIIHWRVDPGPMTDGAIRVSSEAAVRDWIQPMLTEWQSVKLPYAADADPIQTVAIEFVLDGELPEDITAANYERWLEPGEGRYTPAFVIFDHDGSILEAMGEEYDKNKLVGLAEPLLDSTEMRIRGGYIILNGRMINGNPSSTTDAEATPEQFKAVIKHEFGHLLNLAHAVVNTEIALGCAGDSCNGNQGISTMFPDLRTVAQYTLHVDDKVGISWLYPTQDFQDKFCVITGEIQDEDGKGLQGVNVIASAVNDPWIDARSFQSGALYAIGTENGRYILAGLMPGVDYEVRYEELPVTEETDISAGYDPCSTECPSGFGSGLIAGPDGAASVHCDEGGRTIGMETLKISLAEGRAIDGSVSEGEGGGGGSGKKGWCQLERTADYGLRTTNFLGVFVFILILLAFRLHIGRAR